MDNFNQIQVDDSQQNQINQQNQMQVDNGQQKQKKGNKGKRSLLLLALLMLLMTVSIGYSALSSQLKISGTSTIKNSQWDIDVEDGGIVCPDGEVCTINPSNPDSLTPDDGKVTPDNPNPKGAIIWMDGNTVYFKHILSVPGDVFTFNVTFENSGTLDAKVSNVTTSSLNATAQNFMTYGVTYANGNAINQNDRLNAGDSVTFKVTVAYKSTVTTLPTDAELALINEVADGHTGATSLFTINYEQA